MTEEGQPRTPVSTVPAASMDVAPELFPVGERDDAASTADAEVREA